MYKMYHHDPGAFLIYIDSYENGIPAGRYYDPYSNDMEEFSSLVQILIKIDKHVKRRNMRSVPSIYSFDVHSGLGIIEGKIASLAINILFNRNSSWQGYVCVMKSGEKIQFKSALELIMTINNILASRITKLDKEELLERVE